MKKFLAKLALFATIALILNVFVMNVGFAAKDTEKAKEVVEDSKKSFDEKCKDKPNLPECIEYEAYKEAVHALKGIILVDIKEADQCITDEEVNGGYIITIIEEPLTLEESGETKNEDDFVSRICYRNVISYTDWGKKEHLLAELLRDCEITSAIDDILGQEESKLLKVKASCEQVQAYLSKGGTSLLFGYIGTLYKWAAGMVGLISVVVIIFSGIQISAGGGDTQAIDDAKGRIGKSLAGLAVLFLSGLILYTINPTFFSLL